MLIISPLLMIIEFICMKLTEVFSLAVSTSSTYVSPELILLFSTGQTAVKLSGTEAADRAQCAAPDKPIGY